MSEARQMTLYEMELEPDKKLTNWEFEQRMANHLDTVISQVWHLLQEYPETRGNDALLVLIHATEVQKLKGIRELFAAAKEQRFNFESIRRARQLIQARGFFLPEDPVIIKRRRLEKVFEAASRIDPAARFQGGNKG